MKIAFIDVEGTLNHTRTPNRMREDGEVTVDQGARVGIDRGCLVQLQRIVDETNCSLVLSSALRHRAFGQRAVERAMETQGWRGFKFIACTPWLGAFRNDAERRAAEILNWIENNLTPALAGWVVLDDILLPKIAHRQVLCDMYDGGLTAARADAAIKILNATGAQESAAQQGAKGLTAE